MEVQYNRSHISMSSLVPVIVGVADVVNHSTKVQDAREPADLMHQAISEAIKDTGSRQTSSLQSAIDSIDVVNTWTWPYPDLPGLLGQKLGVNAKHKHLSPHGGNQPGLLFDDASKRISTGQTKVAVLTGGEALASCRFVQGVLYCKAHILSNGMCCSEADPTTRLVTTK